MADKKQPTEKEIQDLAKKVDKLVSSKKVKDLMKSSPAGSSSNNPQNEALMKAQLRQMMESMALLEQAGKIKTSGKKEMGSHAFWKTQPVPAYSKYNNLLSTIYLTFRIVAEEIVESGPIEPDTPFDQIRKEPLPLPKDFEWAEINMEDEKEVSFV